MPSLFSKFKKRHSVSSDSTSPSHPSGGQTFNSPASPQSPGRAGAAESRSATHLPASPTPATRPARTQPEILHDVPPVVDFSVSAAGPESAQTHQPEDPQHISHSYRFADEQNRPDLPTTSSNVANPQPDADSLTWHQADHKALPTLPEASPALPLHHGSENHGRELGSSRDYDRVDEQAPRLPPLPHLDSINTDQLSSEQPRPDMIPSSSAAAGSEQPQFHHMSSISPPSEPQLPQSHAQSLPRPPQAATEGVQPQQSALSQYGGDTGAESSRGPSLSRSGVEGSTAQSVQGSTLPPGAQSGSARPVMQEQSHLDPTDRMPALDASLAALSFGSGHTASTPFKVIHDPDALPLEKQRSVMVDSIVAGARERKDAEPGLSEVGQQAFESVGFGDRLGQRGDVEVRTKWLEPVVQQNITVKEHTEYNTVIERDIYKTHIYPIIQPIHDPDPIIHPTRHRFFDAQTGKWHEVIGDEAAIAVIGEDVFRNGPKEYREERKLALPGFDGPIDEEVSRGLLSGAGWKSGTVQPVIRHDGGMEQSAFAARVIEREGVEGKMGDWKEMGTGKRLLDGLTGEDKEAEAVGEVDGLVGGLGEKTVGVAI